MSDVTEALHAFEAREPVRALELVLDAWRRTREPRLAELIAKLGALVATKVAAGAWETEAARRRPEALTSLLATIVGTSKVMKERALLLGAWASDPRLDRWVVAQYEKPPFTSTGSGPFWTALKKLTVKLADPVARDALAKVKSGRLEGVELGPPQPVVPLDADALTHLGALEKALEQRAAPSKGQRTTTELLDEVLEKPADLTLRHVLMDALLEQGHPRGHLLALQLKEGPLTAAEKKKEKALIAEHWDELLGPLAPALKPDSRFARGFLVHAELRAPTSATVENALAGAKGHALWRTVESYVGEGSVLVGGDLPLLREVDTWRVSLEQLVRFSSLESLGMRLSPEDFSVLTTAGPFPRLQSLKLTLDAAQVLPFEAWARGRRWQSLRFITVPRDLPLYCGLLGRELARATKEVELTVVHADFARLAAHLSEADGSTALKLKLELPRVTHQQWSERLVADGLAVLKALEARPGLDVELAAKNVAEVACAPLVAAVKGLGGRVR